ncbi:hypothetical protein Taro_048164, partial [Colocasia esculenta]|nr:hypothetical protein [Colocasia esculenta]
LLLDTVGVGAEKSMEGGGAGDGGGITGTIDFVGSSHGREPKPDLSGQVHLLPCCVKHDGPCPISDYFKPKNTGAVLDGLTVEEAFFRGRKLQGATVTLPDGYCGHVLSKERNLGSGQVDLEGDPKRWVSRAEFRSMTYWNHDSLPSQDDPLIRCFHWFSIANAVSFTSLSMQFFVEVAMVYEDLRVREENRDGGGRQNMANLAGSGRVDLRLEVVPV